MQDYASIFDMIFTEKAIPFWSALLGASFALIGQLMSGIIAIVKDNRLETRRVRRIEALSAVQLQVSLLEILRMCDVVVFHDRLFVSPNDPTEANFGIQAPLAASLEFPYLEGLDAELAQSALLIKYELSRFEFIQSTTDMTAFPYGGIEEARRKAFAKIGLKAIGIIERVSKNHTVSASICKEVRECRERLSAVA